MLQRRNTPQRAQNIACVLDAAKRKGKMIKQRVHVCVALRILFLPPCACQHGMKNEKEREMIFARDEMGNFSFSRLACTFLSLLKSYSDVGWRGLILGLR